MCHGVTTQGRGANLLRVEADGVIGHQHTRMDGAMMLERGLGEILQITGGFVQQWRSAAFAAQSTASHTSTGWPRRKQQVQQRPHRRLILPFRAYVKSRLDRPDRIADRHDDDIQAAQRRGR